MPRYVKGVAAAATNKTDGGAGSLPLCCKAHRPASYKRWHREAVKVELAILAPDFTPAFRLGHDPAERAFKFVQEVLTEA